MYDMESKKLGNENYFSLSDMAIILESIHNETLISQSVSKEIKTIMKELCDEVWFFLFFASLKNAKPYN